MKILILGGTRFQGKYLCEKLTSRGYSLTIANRGITGRVKEGENIQYIRCDRADKNAFETIKEKEFDACIDTSDTIERM